MYCSYTVQCTGIVQCTCAPSRCLWLVKHSPACLPWSTRYGCCVFCRSNSGLLGFAETTPAASHGQLAAVEWSRAVDSFEAFNFGLKAQQRHRDGHDHPMLCCMCDESARVHYVVINLDSESLDVGHCTACRSACACTQICGIASRICSPC